MEGKLVWPRSVDNKRASLSDPHQWMVRTHHDQRFLHPKNDIAREVRVTFRVQCRCELVKPGGVNHHVQVTRPSVVSSQSAKQVAHRTLLDVDWHCQES